MKTQDEPAFISEVASPKRMRLFLYRDGIERSSFGSAPWLGWALVVNQISVDGSEVRVTDHWVETLLEALDYESLYSDQPLEWRWDPSGEVANLRDLQPAFDASRRFDTAINTSTEADGKQRLCFNLYDDGYYRYTLEKMISRNGLSAWVPKEWSQPYPDLPSVENAARLAFDWFH